MVRHRQQLKEHGSMASIPDSNRKPNDSAAINTTARGKSRIVSLENNSFRKSNTRVKDGITSVKIAGLGEYNGEVRNYQANGEGEFRSVDGSVYTGNWKDDKPNGQGKEVKNDGTEYEGLFFEGRRHGKGEVKFKDGSKYEGDFRMGEMHGTVRGFFIRGFFGFFL